VSDALTRPEEAGEPSGPRLRMLYLLPLAIFGGLAAIFLVQLFAGDPQRLPSALIGRPAPTFALSPLPGLRREGEPVPGLTSEELKGTVTIVNVWASWCVPCRVEHPVLMELSRDPRFRLVGINHKDDPENARRFLGQHGNPFAAVGVDPTGRTTIDWGVYGVPETFVVGRDGTIRYKKVGPILPQEKEAFLKAAEAALR
jgi:cytochrome c biogenesis protein CcmG, thiol:disulfide interchange protein DsbE